MIGSSAKGTPMIVRLARFNRAFHVREVDERALEQAKDELREAKRVEEKIRASARVATATQRLLRSDFTVAAAAEGVALALFEKIGHTPGQPMTEADLAKCLETSKCAVERVG